MFVGGYAASVLGGERVTEDVDVVVSKECRDFVVKRPNFRRSTDDHLIFRHNGTDVLVDMSPFNDRYGNLLILPIGAPTAPAAAAGNEPPRTPRGKVARPKTSSTPRNYRPFEGTGAAGPIPMPSLLDVTTPETPTRSTDEPRSTDVPRLSEMLQETDDSLIEETAPAAPPRAVAKPRTRTKKRKTGEEADPMDEELCKSNTNPDLDSPTDQDLLEFLEVLENQADPEAS
ncbi:hypothetical protein N7466_010028 [Penicillium verhagenii]|uniref:uncharacterized protein n=1 Tax=Penicillium verhagenii TaxID=1562060 RepID=UPI002545998E|nr:uncharacterized protein N7466_010028 [Penicillium verhagenii]KAJ5919085.1 hypothetical protein N7466_010028 [Penicillium verhagenii]